MAKQIINTYESKRVKRKGVHAKSKQSKSKNATNYKKAYKGQGR